MRTVRLLRCNGARGCIGESLGLLAHTTALILVFNDHTPGVLRRLMLACCEATYASLAAV